MARRAVDSLVRVAQVGDQGIISVLVSKLKDQSPSVREAALEGLAKLTKKGDREVITKVAARLEDDNENVQKAAMLTLIAIVNASDQSNMLESQVLPELKGPVARELALETLTGLVQRGIRNTAELQVELQTALERVTKETIRALERRRDEQEAVKRMVVDVANGTAVDTGTLLQRAISTAQDMQTAAIAGPDYCELEVKSNTGGRTFVYESFKSRY